MNGVRPHAQGETSLPSERPPAAGKSLSGFARENEENTPRGSRKDQKREGQPKGGLVEQKRQLLGTLHESLERLEDRKRQPLEREEPKPREEGAPGLGPASSEHHLDAYSDDERREAQQDGQVPILVARRLERVIVARARRVCQPVSERMSADHAGSPDGDRGNSGKPVAIHDPSL